MGLERDEDNEDDISDPLTWIRKLREGDKREKNIEVESVYEDKGENAQTVISDRYFLSPEVEALLETGEEITVHAGDVQVAEAEEGELILEDTRAKELARFERDVEERRKIDRYMMACGPTGVSGGGEHMQPDVEEFSSSTAALPQPSAKLFKKKKSIKSAAASHKIDWDDVFDAGGQGTDQDRMEESAAWTPSVSEPMMNKRTWGLVGDDEENENADDIAVLNQLYDSWRTKAAIKEEERKIHEEPDPLGPLRSVKEEAKSPTMDFPVTSTVITSTSEFARSLMTPLEKLEDRNDAITTAPQLNRKRHHRGLSSQKEARSSEATASMLNSMSPDELMEEVNKKHVVDGTSGLAGMDLGLSSALQFLKETGNINEERWNLGRTGKEKKKPLYKDPVADDVKIDYIDEFGRIQNPKEAFRTMSYHFHGKGPGVKKREKKLKKLELERRLKSSNSTDVMPSLKALRVNQQKTGLPFLVLSSANNVVTSKN